MTERTGDGFATRSPRITLNSVFEPGSVHLQWETLDENDLQGELQGFQIQYHSATVESPPVVHTKNVPWVINDVTVDGLIPGGIYYFRVIPKTRAGFPEKLPEKFFPWVEFEVPKSAPNASDVVRAPELESLPINSTAISVRWQIENLNGISGMEVILTAKNGTEIRQEMIWDPGANSTILEGLQPNTEYGVAVVALNKNGRGLEAKQFVRTFGVEAISTTIPSKEPWRRVVVEPPVGLTCQSSTLNEIKVSWKKPPSSRQIVKFTVQYMLAPVDPRQPINASAAIRNETTEMEFTAVNLKQGRRYVFDVLSWDAQGYKGIFGPHTFCETLGEADKDDIVNPGSLETEMPFKLRVKQLNETSLRLEWTGESLTKDENLRFRIVYGLKREDLESARTPKLEVLQPSRNVLTLTKLNAGENYWFLLEIGTDQGGYQAASDPVSYQLQNKKVVDPTPREPTVIYIYSYKEGIIIGVCLAVVVLVVCLLIICCCRNR